MTKKRCESEGSGCAIALTSRQSSRSAEELEKASGGGECKECTGYLVELGGVYKQNADLTRDYSLRMLEYMGARKDYESRIVDM